MECFYKTAKGFTLRLRVTVVQRQSLSFNSQIPLKIILNRLRFLYSREVCLSTNILDSVKPSKRVTKTIHYCCHSVFFHQCHNGGPAFYSHFIKNNRNNSPPVWRVVMDQTLPPNTEIKTKGQNLYVRLLGENNTLPMNDSFNETF